VRRRGLGLGLGLGHGRRRGRVDDVHHGRRSTETHYESGEPLSRRCQAANRLQEALPATNGARSLRYGGDRRGRGCDLGAAGRGGIRVGSAGRIGESAGAGDFNVRERVSFFVALSLSSALQFPVSSSALGE
jgi:hypothetical protein